MQCQTRFAGFWGRGWCVLVENWGGMMRSFLDSFSTYSFFSSEGLFGGFDMWRVMCDMICQGRWRDAVCVAYDAASVCFRTKVRYFGSQYGVQ
jgi:hypothetical protein